MILSIVAAHAWGGLQLIILGSLARTVRIRTVFAAMAVGLYLLVPLTVVLQASWTGLSAPLLETYGWNSFRKSCCRRRRNACAGRFFADSMAREPGQDARS